MARTVHVDWQVLLDENEWDSDAEMALPESQPVPAPPHVQVGRVFWASTLILCLLASVVGLRLWIQAQAGLAAVEKGLNHTLTTERRAAVEGDDLLGAALLDPEAELSWRNWMLGQQRQAWERMLDAQIVDFVLDGDRAMAQVRLTDAESGAVYRESRFYRETAGGWLRSQPAEELWGEVRTWESEYFVFTYRRLDGPAVIEAAPLLDRAYIHMHTALGQVIPVAASPEEKVAVRVVMRGGSNNPWYTRGEPLAVNSPRLMRLPAGVTDGEALAESVAFALRREAGNRFVGRSYQPAPEFLSGLRLWLAWEEELVQAAYRAELVTWLYGNGAFGPKVTLVSYRELCELFFAWEIVAPAVPMTFYCSNDPSPSSFTLRPPMSLRYLPLSLNREGLIYDISRDPLTGVLQAGTLGQPIAVATLLEYTAHTYGQASVVGLLRAAKEGETWRSAAPLLFGVSEAEFEAGWWAWLAAEYGVDTSEFQAARDNPAPEIVLDPAVARQALADYQARLR